MRRPAFYSRSPRTLPPAADEAAERADAPASPETAGADQPPQAVSAKKPGWQPGRRSFAM
ncbi:peptidase S1, partial [Mycobacterium tuberculosis]